MRNHKNVNLSSSFKCWVHTCTYQWLISLQSKLNCFLSQETVAFHIFHNSVHIYFFVLLPLQTLMKPGSMAYTCYGLQNVWLVCLVAPLLILLCHCWVSYDNNSTMQQHPQSLGPVLQFTWTKCTNKMPPWCILDPSYWVKLYISHFATG